MLHDSVVVVRTHGFPFVSHIWDAYGAPLGGPLGRRSSTIINNKQENDL